MTQSTQTALAARSMFRRLQDQLQWRADLLMAERFEDMSREYMFPLPVYIENRLIPVQDAPQVIRLCANLNKNLQARHVNWLGIAVTAVEVPRGGRFRVWADWHAVSRSADRSCRMRLIQYMRETDQGYRSEMLHYQVWRDPDLSGLTGQHNA